MIMNEIGSEFWTGSTKCGGSGVAHLLPAGYDARYVLSGRTALDLIISDAQKTRTIKKAYLPSYCCHTMIEPFVTHAIAIEFYDVIYSSKGIEPIFNDTNDCDIVLLLEYFGFINCETHEFASEQHKKGKLIVCDFTHSLFNLKMEYSCCDYIFGSFRKWFGVSAGFCAKRNIWNDFPHLSVNRTYMDLRRNAFDLKQKFIAGEAVNKSIFLEMFDRAERMLETDYKIYTFDEQEKALLCQGDVDFIRKVRRENAKALISNLLKIDDPDIHIPFNMVREDECPLFIPIFIQKEKRGKLRDYLIREQIYLPIHWPVSPMHSLNKHTSEIYDMELSCICDQRYTIRDMERISDGVKGYLKVC